MMKIKDAIFQGREQLSGFTTAPQLDIELLLTYVLKKRREFLYAHGDSVLSPDQQSKLHGLIESRRRGEPIAYILGKQEFWSLSFKVTTATLIPRPETETLVETVLKVLPHDSTLTVADLGTGCGAIAVALAHACKRWKIIATDISWEALEVAKENAANLTCETIKFVQADWAAPFHSNRLDAIVSNPPYIAPDDKRVSSSVKHYEPSSALFAEEDGFSAFHVIIKQALIVLKPGGWLFLEHGYEQENRLSALLEKSGFVKIDSVCDLEGVSRVISAQRKN